MAPIADACHAARGYYDETAAQKSRRLTFQVRVDPAGEVQGIGIDS